MSDHVDDARDYLAHRTDELAERRAALDNRAARLRARQPSTVDDVLAAEQAAAIGLAHAITAHRRAAAQHDATAIAHEHCAELLDHRGALDRAVAHRLAARVDRTAAQCSRAEADRAEREGTTTRS